MKIPAEYILVILIILLYITKGYIAYREYKKREIRNEVYGDFIYHIFYALMIVLIVTFDLHFLPALMLLVGLYMAKRIGAEHGIMVARRGVHFLLLDVGIEYIVGMKDIKIRTGLVGSKTYHMIQRSVEQGEKVTPRMVQVLRELHLSDTIRVELYKDNMIYEYTREDKGKTSRGADWVCSKKVYHIDVFKQGDENRCFYILDYSIQRLDF